MRVEDGVCQFWVYAIMSRQDADRPSGNPQEFCGNADETLDADGVVVNFEGLVAIDHVSLSLSRREVLGLIGPNGAGKTTLVNVLTGFQPPSAGRVCIDSADVTGWQPHMLARNGIARTFQNGRLFRDYTVRENLEAGAIGMGLSRREARSRAIEVLGWLDLENDADVLADTVPYGIERRIGIARALATHPRWILLDEPAAGLNDHECEELMSTVSRIPDAFGCGVLIIEHNMRVIMNVCERIHVIDFGKTIAEGTPKEVQENADVILAYLGKHRG